MWYWILYENCSDVSNDHLFIFQSINQQRARDQAMATIWFLLRNSRKNVSIADAHGSPDPRWHPPMLLVQKNTSKHLKHLFSAGQTVEHMATSAFSTAPRCDAPDRLRGWRREQGNARDPSKSKVFKIVFFELRNPQWGCFFRQNKSLGDS